MRPNVVWAVIVAALVIGVMWVALAQPARREATLTFVVSVVPSSDSAVWYLQAGAPWELGGRLPTFMRLAPTVEGDLVSLEVVGNPRENAVHIVGRGPLTLTWSSFEPLKGTWPFDPGTTYPSGNPDLDSGLAPTDSFGEYQGISVYDWFVGANAEPAWLRAAFSLTYWNGPCQQLEHSVPPTETAAGEGKLGSVFSQAADRCR